MHTTLKVKLIQHLLKKKQEGGFTLIELLVVIIIIGILAAIALPSFLNQANKAREAEAVTYVGSINRGQQAHYLEEINFSGTITGLGLGIQTVTDNFVYGNGGNVAAANSDIVVQQNAGGAVTPASGALDETAENITAAVFAYPAPGGVALRSFAGVTYITEVTDAAGVGIDEFTTTAVLCESENAIGTPANAAANLIAPTITLGAGGFVDTVTAEPANGECTGQ